MGLSDWFKKKKQPQPDPPAAPPRSQPLSSNPPRSSAQPIKQANLRGRSIEPMADIQINCALPEAAKKLPSSDLDDLVQAMAFCTWNAIQNRLGDSVSEKSAVFNRGGPDFYHSITFKMSVPVQQGMTSGGVVQSLWDDLKRMVEGEGTDSFLADYRAGLYSRPPNTHQ